MFGNSLVRQYAQILLGQFPDWTQGTCLTAPPRVCKSGLYSVSRVTPVAHRSGLPEASWKRDTRSRGDREFHAERVKCAIGNTPHSRSKADVIRTPSEVTDLNGQRRCLVFPTAGTSPSHRWSRSRCQLHTPYTCTWPGRCLRWNQYHCPCWVLSRSQPDRDTRRCWPRSLRSR